jgi:hypothetical protein
MTDINPNRWGDKGTAKRYIRIESLMIVGSQTLLHQRAGWRLKGNYEVLTGLNPFSW